MKDCFAMLGEARRPWCEPEALKERFRARTNDAHPDRVHGAAEAERRAAEERYAELNSAHLTLRDPRSRLLHLLELETGERPRDIQRIPPGTMDLFVEVGQACRDADAYLARRAEVTSPMLKVRLFEEGLGWTDRLNALQARVNAGEAAFNAELEAMTPAFEQAPPPGSDGRAAALPLGRLEEIYRGMSYVARWTAQIQERIVQLASF